MVEGAGELRYLKEGLPRLLLNWYVHVHKFYFMYDHLVFDSSICIYVYMYDVFCAATLLGGCCAPAICFCLFCFIIPPVESNSYHVNYLVLGVALITMTCINHTDIDARYDHRNKQFKILKASSCEATCRPLMNYSAMHVFISAKHDSPRLQYRIHRGHLKRYGRSAMHNSVRKVNGQNQIQQISKT